jgi:hypothetical protein
LPLSRYRAAGDPPLPPDWLRGFVSHALASCGPATGTPAASPTSASRSAAAAAAPATGAAPSGSTRLVRLVCAFVSSLVRARALDAGELWAEAQAFCIEHGRVKEAAALFRLLRGAAEAVAAPSASLPPGG